MKKNENVVRDIDLWEGAKKSVSLTQYDQTMLRRF